MTQASGKSPLVCVVPTSGTSASASAVDVATIVDGKIVARERIDATGQRTVLAKDGCTGWKTARWSPDARRLYLRSEFACPGGVRRTSNGLFAISSAGDWLDVQGIGTMERNGDPNDPAVSPMGVRVLRYGDAGIPNAVPGEIAQALEGRALAVNAQRMAAGAPLTPANIVDASRHLEPAVEAAWLIETGQHFALDAKQLTQLADAGVPGSVTDAMIAVSYPKAFAVNPSLGDGDVVSLQSARDYRNAYGSAYGYGSNGRNVQVFLSPYYSPYYSPYMYSPYGYSGLGLGYYSRYGYSPYGEVLSISV